MYFGAISSSFILRPILYTNYYSMQITQRRPKLIVKLHPTLSTVECGLLIIVYVRYWNLGNIVIRLIQDLAHSLEEYGREVHGGTWQHCTYVYGREVLVGPVYLCIWP